MGDECLVVPSCHMWLLLTTLLGAVGVGLCGAICPPRCRCNDDALHVACVGANLEVVPIQLNPEVHHIDISNNKIANVIFTFTFYNHLISLNLSSNKIQTLGSSNFVSQHHLKHLNLSTNELDSLSKDSLKGLHAVSELDLSFNQIETISVHAFRDLHTLEVLRLTGNRLVSLEAGMLKPTTLLRELYLDDNQLVDMPGRALGDSFNLVRLTLSDNLLISVTEADMVELPSLQILHLDNNVINDIEPGALSGLSSLKHLDLGDNNFTVVPTASLSKLSNLTRLRFSGNFIRAMPPVAFRGLFQLRYLYLTHLDYLTAIDPRTFVDNINLERIWLDDNVALQTLPTRLFYGNGRLTHVSIRNNHLSSLEASHFPLDQLAVLHMASNPLVCNCTLLWLWRLGQEQRVREYSANNTRLAINSNELHIDVEHIDCADPVPVRGKVLADLSESQIGCSISWIAASMIVACISLGVVATVSLVFFGQPFRRMKPLPSLPPMEANNHHHYHQPYRERPNVHMLHVNGGDPLTISYEDAHCVDKYIIGTNVVNEYQTLPPWDPYSNSKDCADNDLPEYEAAAKTRPHIVYV